MSITSKKLTSANIKKYLNNCGNLCPHCQSDHITTTIGDAYVENLSASRKVECLDCGEEWLDIYLSIDRSNRSVNHAIKT